MWMAINNIIFATGMVTFIAGSYVISKKSHWAARCAVAGLIFMGIALISRVIYVVSK